MNYLGHAFLSGDDSGELAGNFAGDFFKGNRFEGLPEPIVRGIRLHRFIDMTTDNHPFVKNLKVLAMPVAGRYSGVVADLWIDHLICNHFQKLSAVPLGEYCNAIFVAINPWMAFLPNNFCKMVLKMEEEKWLESYYFRKGVEEALLGITQRRNVPVPLAMAVNGMPHSSVMENQLIEFIEDMEQGVENLMSSLNS